MASDLLLKLEGAPGSSQDKAIPEAIHLETFSWDVTAPSTISGERTARVQVDFLKVVKEADRASVFLMMALVTNAIFEKGTLTVRKAGGNPLAGYTLRMSNVGIRKISKSYAGEKVYETVSLAFQKFEFEYREQDARGGTTAPAIMNYDMSSAQ